VQAQKAKEETEKSAVEEQRQLAQLEASTNLQNKEYNGINIPAGFAQTGVEGESLIEEGVVITDTKGNEYVWIEIPNDSTGPNYTEVKDKEENTESYYKAIETALISYATEYRKGDVSQSYSWEDSWYEGCGIDSMEEYKILYNKMLNNIYLNGGFWIGRYEAGKKKDMSFAASQANSYPYADITCAEAEEISANIAKNLDGYSSSLMFGLQWDLVMKYLQIRGASYEEIAVNSNKWGNYANNDKLVIRNTDAKYKIFSESNWTSINSAFNKNMIALLTTGADESFSKMNIYDLAGNVFEWTLECSTNSRYPCVFRGGGYGNLGENNPAANRRCNSIDYLANGVGFRISIY